MSNGLCKYLQSYSKTDVSYPQNIKITLVQGGPKNRTVLTVDFATVSDREACNMSKVCKFYLEKGIKLAC